MSCQFCPECSGLLYFCELSYHFEVVPEANFFFQIAVLQENITFLCFDFLSFFALASAHYQPIIGSNVLNRLHRAFRLSIDEVDYEIKGLSKGPLPLSPIYNCPDVYLAVCYCYFVIVTWPL